MNENKINLYQILILGYVANDGEVSGPYVETAANVGGMEERSQQHSSVRN